MSGDLSAVKKSVEEILIDLMSEKFMSTGIQESLMGGLEQLRVGQQEKDDIRAKFEEDKEKIQKDKDQLLTKQTVVREAVTRELLSMRGVAQMEEETVKSQVGKLAKAIQQLQA
jgi:hypothetical protein